MSDDEDYGPGCECTTLCSMGPTCPGGMLAGVEGAGCWRYDEPPSTWPAAAMPGRHEAPAAFSIEQYGVSAVPYYPEAISRWVEDTLALVHALEDTMMVRTLAVCPSLLHWLAAQPAWATYVEALQARRAAPPASP